MRLIILILFSAWFFVGYTSCVCDCLEAGGYIRLKLMKDGHDALFGPEASIHKDSVRFFLLNNVGYDDFIFYNDNTKTMDLFIGHQREYILKIENIRTDTIVGKIEVTDQRGCCDETQLTEVKFNGQIICVDGCEEIIEIQL